MLTHLINASVEFVSPLTPTILQYFLKPEKFIDYLAGQYLQIKIADETYSYSIANAPLGAQHYELHIRHSTAKTSNPVLLALRNHANICIQLPFGDCYLQKIKPNKPIIFIAIGTGFAPIKAMIEQLFADGDNREFKLYWSAKSQSDLYLHDKVLNWQNSSNNFTYYAVAQNNRPLRKLSSAAKCAKTKSAEPQSTQINEGLNTESTKQFAAEVEFSKRLNESCLLDNIIREHGKKLSNYQFVMCGPFDLIYTMRDTLLTCGVEKQNMHSDAFNFE